MVKPLLWNDSTKSTAHMSIERNICGFFIFWMGKASIFDVKILFYKIMFILENAFIHTFLWLTISAAKSYSFVSYSDVLVYTLSKINLVAERKKFAQLCLQRHNCALLLSQIMKVFKTFVSLLFLRFTLGWSL